MITNASIRTARTTDAQALARVEYEAWRDTYAALIPHDILLAHTDMRQSVPQWIRRLAHGGFRQQCFVADAHRGAVVGYAHYGLTRDFGFPARPILNELYVLPAYQEMGYGCALVRAVARVLASHGQNSLCVEVLEGNPSRYFYEAMGAQLLEQKQRPFAGVKLPSLIYRWADLTTLLA